jgi:two-component system OmpR family sensor kinase
MILIAFLYYQNEKILYFDLAKTKMQNVVSNISSKIIFAHMTNTELDTSSFFDTNEYKISFYNKEKEKMFGNLNDEIDFTKEIIQREQHFILIDNATYGHLGIQYIVIEENLFFKTIQQLKINIITLFLVIYSILSLIGFFLAKLFLKPIKDERKKLNNFIKDTTHELNTPISAILMSSETTTLTPIQVKRIQLSAQKVSEIYKDLSYIFLEDKEIKVDLEEINIKKVIEKEVQFFEALAEKKRILISCQLDDFLYKIDENDFIRLFNNIVSNAIKYNKPKGKIFIELKDSTLIIKDTGIGIEERKIDDIFKRYFRATNEYGGFGIGLNIVRNICLAYEIKIDVKSKIKEGTTFIFKFQDIK